MNDWQPIATAPSDGTRVLLFGPDGITTGYYDPGVKGHEDRFPEVWKGAFEPTHWMHLPEPPPESPKGNQNGIDADTLLRKYISLIFDEEGTDYLELAPVERYFSADELSRVQRIAQAVRTERGQ